MTLLNSKPAAVRDPGSARASVGARQPIRWRTQIAAYLFLLPALALFAIFAWYPILSSVLMSFQNVSLNAESTWIGFRNYERMFSDPVFVSSWRNSFEFAILSILIGFFIPVLVGILVNEMKLAKGFFRVVYFLPSVIPALIAILVWKLIYAPSGGLLNSFITTLGGTGQNWLFNPALVKPSILIIMTWGGFGGTMLIYLASLQDLPIELYEAAEIDGATPWQRIRHITLPFLRPTMIVLLIVQVLGIVQIFLEPFVLTEGGPGQATTTPVLTLYRKAFLNGEYGLASAWSVLLMVVLGIISILYLRATRSQNS